MPENRVRHQARIADQHDLAAMPAPHAYPVHRIEQDLRGMAQALEGLGDYAAGVQPGDPSGEHVDGLTAELSIHLIGAIFGHGGRRVAGKGEDPHGASRLDNHDPLVVAVAGHLVVLGFDVVAQHAVGVPGLIAEADASPPGPAAVDGPGAVVGRGA